MRVVRKDLKLQYLKGIGPKRVSLFNKLGIHTIHDLLYHFPRTYEDRVENESSNLVVGSVVTLSGIILGSQNIKTRNNRTITKAAIQYSGQVVYGVWFNQSFIQKRLSPGKNIIVTGKLNHNFGKLEMSISDYQLVDSSDELIHTGRIVPMYPATENLTPKVMRQVIKGALDGYGEQVEEFLPEELLKKYELLQIKEALHSIHFPESLEEANRARKRFVFEELFLLQLGLASRKTMEEEQPGIQHKPDAKFINGFTKSLPFRLTKAQLKVLEEVNRDMISSKQMNRLIQGDVGSGKTIVAVIALLMAVSSGYQGALMAPTEILAEQHFLGLKELLEDHEVTIGLLTGSTTVKERELLLEQIASGKLDIVVGTHALIQDDVEFKNLSLAITDEQHRFGVRQRALLRDKGLNADVLVMTATPIPRTLGMTLYGDLDISIIDELPPGRKPIKTFWISEEKRNDLYGFIAKEIGLGRQTYIVCPLVEESEKLEVESATELAEDLQNGYFSKYAVGLVHGRLKTADKERIMTQFRKGLIDILVSTTVIEVGVNVPNASIMLIQDADRFGLAQLHQLRGRVGRGEYQSYCILMAEPRTQEGKKRMKVMEQTNDGFVIAEEDLKLRGPGEFFGTRQSGLPDLKLADLIKDLPILEIARNEAFSLIQNDPKLSKGENKLLKHSLLEKFKEKSTYINVS